MKDTDYNYEAHTDQPSTAVQRYVDSAMFRSEPLKASDGPKVYLLWMTPDPLGAMAAMAKMYRGEVVRDISRDVSDDDRRETLRAMGDTKLKAPMEAVKLHFMIEGVTRSFTHQMVRQRTAAYAQESLRFAVKEDMAEGVALPPSLAGTHGLDEFPLIEPWDYEHLDEWDDMSDAQKNRLDWDYAVEIIDRIYHRMVNRSMPAEDARGLLPHNITTRLNYVTDLRALQDHGGNRLCTQAQFEWRVVFTQIAKAIREYGCTSDVLPWDWQQEAIADLFRPACYLTGKCEFAAQGFDRKCKIRGRVDEFHQAGIPSSQWEHGWLPDPGTGSEIEPIHPAEWLADPAAAR